MLTLKKYFYKIINEGGNVFDQGSSPIKLENIEPTLKMFKMELARIFPKIFNDFNGFIKLGSTGKKPISGDIDLAIDEKIFKEDNLENWDINKEDVINKFSAFKKRARNASVNQLMKRAIIVCIADKIKNNSVKIITDDKSSGNGVLFCLFQQYNENLQELNKTVQIDINFGNIDWLKFAYHSDSYTGNIKGLHRTQLMLTLFAVKGYTFSHNYGVKDKKTNTIVANSSNEAIELLNKEYGFRITQSILSNYYELQKFLQKNVKKSELELIYDTFLHILDSTRCDIPEDLQPYWIENQDRLGLKGKFLPNTSNLYNLKK